ncbi:MAG: hypothetical protein WA702_11440 [Bradyrhizobium sp.]|uniref:hypothetical protein n=1 Tax=Bradyrhizobium sp. TaxID=376 RepID=UPI003C7BB3B5
MLASGPAFFGGCLPFRLGRMRRRLAVDFVNPRLQALPAKSTGIGWIERIERDGMDIGLERPALRLRRIVDSGILHGLHGFRVDINHVLAG